MTARTNPALDYKQLKKLNKKVRYTILVKFDQDVEGRLGDGLEYYLDKLREEGSAEVVDIEIVDKDATL